MSIEVQAVSKRFERRANDTGPVPAALDAVSISVASGKMLALVGPSGSGKTTLLRCIAGLETPDEGSIRIGDREVFSSAGSVNVPTEQRNIGLIFQSYALWPNMTVQRNVAYPLRRRKMSEDECASRVKRYLEMVDCGHLAQRYPHELSGGQQQRIALARALVYEPAIVLFDEPLSNLDPTLREHLRGQIRDIQRSVGFTGVYVTHDQTEAFYVGDHVAILRDGRVVQAGSPDDIYGRPNSAAVAAFVGASNSIAGQLAGDGRSLESPGLGRIELARPCTELAARGTRDVVLMTRPEAVGLASAGAAAPGQALATVVERVPFGGCDEYVLKLANGQLWRARVDLRAERVPVGSQVALALEPGSVLVYPAGGAA